MQTQISDMAILAGLAKPGVLRLLKDVKDPRLTILTC